MKKTTLLVMLIIFSCLFLGWNNRNEALQKQEKEQLISDYKYNFANSSDLNSKINYAKDILSLEPNNAFAKDFLGRSLKKLSETQRKELGLNILDIAKANLENEEFFTYAFAIGISSNLSLTKLDNFIADYFRYQLVNGTLNVEFINNNNHFFAELLYRNAFRLEDLDLVDKILQYKKKHVSKFAEMEQLSFYFNAYTFYSWTLKNSDKLSFFDSLFQRDLRSYYAKEKEYFLDLVIANKEEYFLLNPEMLIGRLVSCGNFEVALDLADDYKNMLGIDEVNKKRVRASAFAKNLDFNRAFEVLYPFRKSDKDYFELLVWLEYSDKFEKALELSKEFDEKSSTAFTVLAISQMLIELEKEEELAEFLAKNSNDKIKKLIILMNKCIYGNEKSEECSSLLYDFFDNDLEAILNNLENSLDLNIIVYTSICYGRYFKDQKLLNKIYLSLKDTTFVGTNEIYWTNISVAMLELGNNMVLAEDLILRAYELFPVNNENSLSLARLHYIKGDYQKAKRYIDITLNLDKYDSFGNLGLIYMYAGDIYRANELNELALEFYEKAANQRENPFFKYQELKQRFKNN